MGIPKTIDNDVDIIDRSFGFTTSVEHAQAAIQSAKTEARCNLPNGIGIVKLMGRSAGFIAVHSTLASGDVDLCLVRVPFDLMPSIASIASISCLYSLLSLLPVFIPPDDHYLTSLLSSLSYLPPTERQ